TDKEGFTHRLAYVNIHRQHISYIQHSFFDHWKEYDNWQEYDHHDTLIIVPAHHFLCTDSHLGFSKDDVITVLEKEGEWWRGCIGDQSGFFPSNYVKPKEPDVCIFR
uniref:SH3 domain-containing protein n=1 Tax=Sinocyclocheilus anshuiensis TaxID=1608454 RepID=A0A671KKE5_9TELE